MKLQAFFQKYKVLLLGGLVLVVLSVISGNKLQPFSHMSGISMPPAIGGVVSEESMGDSYMPGFAAKNTLMYDDGAQYDVQSFNAYIESTSFEKDCTTLFALEKRDGVRIESKNEGSYDCSAQFVVEKESLDSFLAAIEELDPTDLSEYQYSIKRQVESVVTEKDIVAKRLAIVEKTMADATAAYDAITKTAQQTNNAEALATIIDSKLKSLERLTSEQLNLTARLESLAKQESRLAEELSSVRVSVSIRNDAYIRFDDIKSSWRSKLRQTISEMNGLVQALTFGLVSLVMVLVQVLIYGAIILALLKHAAPVIKKWLQEIFK